MLRFRRALLWLLRVGVALAPVALAVLLIAGRYRANLGDFVPVFNDEISYWHQAVTFHTVGFNGGYYTVDELPPAAQFTRYYTHGPWYPLVYGMLAHGVGGWRTDTASLINMVLFSVAALVFCVAARLDARQLLITGLCLVTFYPAVISLTTNMQEMFQQVLAIMLALIFQRALTQTSPPSRRFKLFALVMLTLISLTRISWSLFFLPFFLLTDRRWQVGGVLVSLFKSAVFMAGTLAAVNLIGAPGNSSFADVIAAFGVSLSHGLALLWQTFSLNVQRFFDPTRLFMELLQSYQILALIVFFSGTSAWLLVRWRRSGHPPAALPEALFHTYQLVMILITSFTLYIVGTGGDYRVFAAHLLLSMLVLVGSRRYLPVLALVAVNLIFVRQFMIFHRDIAYPRYFYDRERIAAFRESLAGAVVYDSGAESGWCNTLLFQVNNYRPELLAVPPGVGLSFFWDANDEGLALPLKSKYVLAAETDAQTLRERGAQLERLHPTNLGDLYYNNQSGCSR